MQNITRVYLVDRPQAVVKGPLPFRGVGRGGQGGRLTPLARQFSYFDHINEQKFGLRPPWKIKNVPRWPTLEKILATPLLPLITASNANLMRWSPLLFKWLLGKRHTPNLTVITKTATCFRICLATTYLYARIYTFITIVFAFICTAKNVQRKISVFFRLFRSLFVPVRNPKSNFITYWQNAFFPPNLIFHVVLLPVQKYPVPLQVAPFWLQQSEQVKFEQNYMH